MNRERPGWYQSSGESDGSGESDESANEQRPEAGAGSRPGEESSGRAPSWRRRDKYDPFERLRRRRAQAEAERVERAEQAERAAAERAEAQRRSPSGAPSGNPYADQPLAGPWGDGSAQETIAGDYPVIVNDPDEKDEKGRKDA